MFDPYNEPFPSTFSDTGVIEKDDRCLTKTFVEYIDGARIYLESESNGDLPILQEMRLHYSRFVRHLICNTPGRHHIQSVSSNSGIWIGCFIYS